MATRGSRAEHKTRPYGNWVRGWQRVVRGRSQAPPPTATGLADGNAWFAGGHKTRPDGNWARR